VLEKEDLPTVTAWSNDPKFGGEFEPLEQNSLHEIEKWYNNLGSKEKWFIIEKKDSTKIGQIMHTPEGPHYTIGYTVLPDERGKGYSQKQSEFWWITCFYQQQQCVFRQERALKIELPKESWKRQDFPKKE
jgi:hypothetical protein